MVYDTSHRCASNEEKKNKLLVMISFGLSCFFVTFEIMGSVGSVVKYRLICFSDRLCCNKLVNICLNKYGHAVGNCNIFNFSLPTISIHYRSDHIICNF